jgi:hypothetical protein
MPPGLSDPSVLTNVYFVILRQLQPFLKAANVESFPRNIFYDEQLEYYDFSRVGGTLGHLQKNMPILDQSDVKQKLPFDVELLDDLIMLYHLGMSARFKQASAHLQNQTQTISQLEETNRRIKRAKEQVRLRSACVTNSRITKASIT